MIKKFFSGLAVAVFLLVSNFLCTHQVFATTGDPVVSLVSPIGGETFSVGEKITIKWNQVNVDMVTIGYKSCPSCLDWIVFGKDVEITNTTGSYDWIIPSTFSSGINYQIEVIAYHKGVGSIVIDSGFFDINPASGSNQAPLSTPVNQASQPTVSVNLVNQPIVSVNPVSQPNAVVPLLNTNAYKSVVKVKTYALNKNFVLEEIAEGSGIIIGTFGLILTNDHVVSKRSDYDNSDYETTFQICLTKNINEEPSCDYLAKLISRDEDKDVALLQIVDTSGGNDVPIFPYLHLNQTDVSQVNDTITTIGYPSIGGDTITITSGIISGKASKYGNSWIKTDAAISFGSSGGAAVDSIGNVIGITTQVASDVSGQLGFLLSSASIFDWVESNKYLTPIDGSLLDRMINLSRKQKILKVVDKYIQSSPYPRYTIDKPVDWTFKSESENIVKIFQKNDKDGGYVIVDLLRAPYLTSLGDIKPMILKSFNDLGFSSLVRLVKEKEVKINNVKGKLITLSANGKMLNSYIFPQKEYLVWVEYVYGKDDKDKEVVDSIVNSFKIISDKTTFTETHKYVNDSPKFSVSTNVNWAILKQNSKASPLKIQNKKNKEVFVSFSLEKISDADGGLSNEEYINSVRDMVNSSNQKTASIDYNYTIDKTIAHFKLNKEINDVMIFDGTEKTVSQDKILSFNRDYYIKINNNFLAITVTALTDNKKIFQNALVDFNKVLSTLSFK